MEAPRKPSCYDSVPACLCTECQLYDVHCAESSSLSTTSFLPRRYAASLSSSPTASCAVSSVLSTRPSCSIADSTCGLANTNVPPRRPSRVRRRFDFAVSSSSFMLPVSSTASVAVSPSSVAVSPSSVAVSPSSVAVSPSSVAVSSSSVAVSSSSVAVSPGSVAVSSGPVQPSPVGSVQSSFAVASSGPVSSVPVTPVLPSRSVSAVPPRARSAPVWSRPVPPSRPTRYAAPPSRLLPSPSLLPHVPVVCLFLVAVPVLLATPFGFALSFLLR